MYLPEKEKENLIKGSDWIKGYRYISILLALLIFGMPLVSASTVTGYGWNSCSKGWYKTGGTFENYCPFCHHSGVLIYNPKGTYEGEWTCKNCDADFCNCGRCKASGSGVYLKKAVVVKKSNTSSTPKASDMPHGSGLNKVELLKYKLSTDWVIFKGWKDE